MAEFSASLCGREQPADWSTVGVALALPGGNLPSDHVECWQSTIETLVGQDGQFAFRHVQPAAVLRRRMELQLAAIRRASGAGKAAYNEANV